MLDACWCNYDHPEFYRKTVQVARKMHKCDECRGHIMKGERYEYVYGKWDGDLGVYKTCCGCLALRDWVTGNLPCFCWHHTDMISDAAEAIREAQDRAPEETRGLYFAFLRKVWHIRLYKRKHGELVKMTSDEMFPKSMKRIREALEKYGKDDRS